MKIAHLFPSGRRQEAGESLRQGLTGIGEVDLAPLKRAACDGRCNAIMLMLRSEASPAARDADGMQAARE